MPIVNYAKEYRMFVLLIGISLLYLIFDYKNIFEYKNIFYRGWGGRGLTSTLRICIVLL